MKKALKYTGIAILILFVLAIVVGLSSDSGKESFKEGMEAAQTEQIETDNSVNPNDTSKQVLSMDKQVYLDYLDQMKPLLQDVQDTANDIGPLALNVADGTLTDDEMLMIQLSVTIHKKGYDEAEDIIAPPELEKAHNTYLEALELFRDGVIGFEKAATEDNPSLFEPASAKVLAAQKKMLEANSLADDFRETYLE